MNALAHCVEAAWSPRRTPEAEAMALAGAARTAPAPCPPSSRAPVTTATRTTRRRWPPTWRAPSSPAGACRTPGWASTTACRSSSVGAPASPHGLLNAVLLPHSIRCNEPAVPDAVARIGAALGDPDDAAGAVDRLRAALGLPARLSEIGVDEGELEVVARMAPGNGNVAANPRPLGEADVLALLRDAW